MLMVPQSFHFGLMDDPSLERPVAVGNLSASCRLGHLSKDSWNLPCCKMEKME